VFLAAPAKEEKVIRGLIFGPDDPATVVASPDPSEVEERDAEEEPFPVGEPGIGMDNPAGISQPAEAGCPPGTQPTTTIPTLGSTLTDATVLMAGEGNKLFSTPTSFEEGINNSISDLSELVSAITDDSGARIEGLEAKIDSLVAGGFGKLTTRRPARPATTKRPARPDKSDMT
jgi:hypothetical protein